MRSGAPKGGTLIPFRRVAGRDTEISDEALVAACAVADLAALGAIFDRFHQGVYRFLSRLVGPGRAEVDDLVQATFLEVLRAAPSFRNRSSVRTWIFGIAANLARHHVRGEVRRGAMLQAVAREARTAIGDAPPDERASRRQLIDRLGRALELLSHDQRTAFVLCHLEGISGAEVARTLGVREGTLWRWLHEARTRLRAELGGRP